MRSQEDSQVLDAAARSAVACEHTTGLPAELTVAQWALESGWGGHEPGNNCFGIKAYPGCYGVQLLTTWEVIDGVDKLVNQEFATFPTLGACFEKHANIICKESRYQQAWQQYQTSRDVFALIEGIAPIYASSPAYAATLGAIISMPSVVFAIEKARL